MLEMLSPRKQNNGNGNAENQRPDRPQYIHVANPFQNVPAPDSLRSPSTRTRYSRDQLCEVFTSTAIAPPDNPLLRQFDIFSEQLLKPLMLSQSSAEEQMACLLLSNGTWSPSGVPAAPGPPGRGQGGQPMQDYRGAPGQRGRGMIMQQRRFPQRALESDRVDNWRSRAGPGTAGGPPGGELWQSRQAESRLAPNWSQPPQSPDQQAVSPFGESPPQQQMSKPPSSFDSLLQNEASKLFAEDITPYWTAGQTKHAAPTKSPDPPQQTAEVSQQATVPASAPGRTPIIDGESLWNTLSTQDLKISEPPKPVVKNLSPISSDPAVLMAKKSEPVVETAKPKASEQPTPPVPSQPETENEQQAWFYVDPSGTMQGPFSGQQMEEWDNEGYFPDDLRLRPAVSGLASAYPTDERGFITLSKLRSMTVLGGKSPFVACNLSPRQLTPREIEENRMLQQQQQPKPSHAQQPIQQQSAQVNHHPQSRQQPSQQNYPQQDLSPPAPDIRRQSWGSSLSSISSDADVPVQQPQAVSRLGIALTSDEPSHAPREDESAWDEPVTKSVEPERPKSQNQKQTKQNQNQKQQQQQQVKEEEEKKKRNRKKSKPEKEKEAPIDPLMNAEPAEVRRARMAAEQLRIAEENARKLEDRDSYLAILEEKRILREKEREMERRNASAQQHSRPASNAQRSVPGGPPALPATAKWAQSAKAGGNRTASLLEIQRQEEMAEQSERVQEEQRRTLAAVIAQSTQQASSNWSSKAAPANSSAAPWGSYQPEPVRTNSSNNRQGGSGGGGFWDDGDDDDSFRPQQQNKPAPKLSNILGSSSSSNTAHSKNTQNSKKDSKPNLQSEMSPLASWVVSELQRRYASVTSLSSDIVPAFARLLGTIDEVYAHDELMQRASPYFYRQEDARTFITDFILARTKLQREPVLSNPSSSQPQKSSNNANNNSGKGQNQTSNRQPEKTQPEQVAQQNIPKSKAKKKPIPVSATALFKLVGPPPPAPQPDD